MPLALELGLDLLPQQPTTAAPATAAAAIATTPRLRITTPIIYVLVGLNLGPPACGDRDC